MVEVDAMEVDRGQEARSGGGRKEAKRRRRGMKERARSTKREGQMGLLSVSVNFLPDRVRSFFWTGTRSAV